MLRENLDLAERLWWRQDVDLHTKAAAVAMAVVQVHPFEVTGLSITYDSHFESAYLICHEFLSS